MKLEKYLKKIEGFEKVLGINFQDKKLLLQALTHRSYINENRDFPLGQNERLEFLGDAVLELVVTEHLYGLYPDKPEGELTVLRSALVNTSSLSGTAAELGVNDYLLLSRGESKDTGRARQYILANAFEAIIGAVYLDSGFDESRSFLKKHLLIKLPEILKHALWQDSKSRFQEVAQEKVSITPSYETVDEVGPDHDRKFTVGVYLGDEEVARGEGKSKQEAQQKAAKKALEEKGWE